jgi:predicted DNA-binding transcriptional regulator YafY
MRGEHSACQLRVIRTIEASPIGLPVAKIADREETDKRTLNRGLEALQAAGFSLSAEKDERGNRCAFRETSKFRPFPPFTLTEARSLYSYRGLIPSSIHSSVHGLEVGPASPNRGSE